MPEATRVRQGRTLAVLTQHPERPELTLEGDDQLETVLTGIQT
jgi:hypothetical protein